MPNDRIATQFFLLQKLKSALLWCIYSFHNCLPSRTVRPSGITPRNLEHMLCDETAEPKALPLSLLEEITDGFSDEQRIGIGGFAVVYKGKLKNRTVAVKRMSNACMNEKLFHREVQCLMMTKHINIVRFLGYCADTQGIMEKYEGKLIMADVHQRLLCFEYLPKGSLHEYITDTSREPRWRDCYQIITGICHGLHYLHQENIVHLDLKPANILLDDNLVAKITDFGLSRCFIGETETRVISKIGGTLGYLAPECFNRHTHVTNQHSYRLDIYSLGIVIMEILTGKKEDYAVDNVVESWSNMVETSRRDEQMEQVRVCAEIGIECTNFNPAKRPDTQRIINRLDGIQTMDEYIETSLATSQEAEIALNEQHRGMPNSPGETSSKVVESWSNMVETSQRDEHVEEVRECAEIGIEYNKFNPAKRQDTQSTINRLDGTETMDEYIKTGLATSQQAEIAPNEQHHDMSKSRGETSSKVVESWSNMVDTSQRDEQLEQVRVCAEIGIECTKFNPAKRPDTESIINRQEGLETMDEYIETSWATSQQAEIAPSEQHRSMPNSLGDTRSKVVESWSNMVEPLQRDEQLEKVRVCAEIGIECTNFNPTKRPDTQCIINRLDGIETMDEYIETCLATSHQAKIAPDDQHQGMLNSPGETSSKENVITVTVEGTSPCNNICENTANIDKLNKTMDSLNPDIRRCFEFCIIFPRGSKLRRDDLVRLWISQGFVKTSCASEDMEEIARWYIQDLVSISFLEANGTSSNIDCFTVNDALHDILDKVAAKCFRIDNVRSNRGEVWEGDVPRTTEHLLIQHYDGEFITETITGLKYLRTLIVYIVGKDTPIEEKVIESICKRLPELRVLAVAFSQEHDPIDQPKEFLFPESVGELKYLRYLVFRANRYCKITLPRTINELHHIQLLDFGNGKIVKFTFAKLVNLRHIFCFPYVKLPYVGRLSSLQTIPCFVMSKEQGCELNQLRDLTKLRGQLEISGLEHSKSKEQALQANLNGKFITDLTLQWDYDDDRMCNPIVQADVLEGMCPPVGLQKLALYNFAGSRYPDWMVAKQNGGPKYLLKLHLWKCSQLVCASELAEAFPHLRELQLWECSWGALPDNMDHLQSHLLTSTEGRLLILVECYGFVIFPGSAFI